MADKLKAVRVDHGGDTINLDLERAEIEKVGAELVGVTVNNEDEVVVAVKDADAVITSAFPITRKVFESSPKLRVAVRTGVGYDCIDVDAATDNGVLVVNVPDYCYEEVSNHVIALMLILAKKIIPQNNLMAQGKWNEARKIRPPMDPIFGQTLGIIGTGNIGRMAAEKAKVFKLKILGFDPYVDRKVCEAVGITLVDMSTLLKESDYVVIQCLLSKETHQFISDKEFGMMKPSAYIINCARGPIIDEAALIKALRTKKIAGAGIDVFEKEPTDPDNPLLKMDNVVKLPHSAFFSDAAFKQLRISVAQEAARVISGKLPRNYVNKNVKPRFPLS